MPRSKEEKKQLLELIYGLEIGDVIQDPISGWQITAVPGGWIYSRNSNTQVVFVPDNRHVCVDAVPSAQPELIPESTPAPSAGSPDDVVLPASRRTTKAK
jgi:hypothetical protein